VYSSLLFSSALRSIAGHMGGSASQVDRSCPTTVPLTGAGAAIPWSTGAIYTLLRQLPICSQWWMWHGEQDGQAANLPRLSRTDRLQVGAIFERAKVACHSLTRLCYCTWDMAELRVNVLSSHTGLDDLSSLTARHESAVWESVHARLRENPRTRHWKKRRVGKQIWSMSETCHLQISKAD
jgi:hypothetical protein